MVQELHDPQRFDPSRHGIMFLALITSKILARKARAQAARRAKDEGSPYTWAPAVTMEDPTVVSTLMGDLAR